MGLNEGDIRRIIWTALMAFAAVYYPLAVGLGGFANFGEAKAAALALIPAAIAAAFSAVKNLVLADTSSLK